jgi:hypothetical protein
VAHLLEALRRCRPDPLRRRVGCDQVRVLLLERAQLVEEPVVLGVRDLWVVEHVIAVVVVVDVAAQLVEPRLHVLQRRSRH